VIVRPAMKLSKSAPSELQYPLRRRSSRTLLHSAMAFAMG
jgi:hypothetical protein